MNILITNDDGFEAPGLRALFEALTRFGDVYVVAPLDERSACSHAITLVGSVTVKRVDHDLFGTSHVVTGTPADCVRLALVELLKVPIDLVVSGINRGANAGVDTFYSGTVAGAREGAISGIRSIAVSQAIRDGVEIDWGRAGEAARFILTGLLSEELPSPGFWNVNLPAPIPEDYRNRIHRVPITTEPMPAQFRRREHADGTILEFDWGKAYWHRNVTGNCDYAALRDGNVTISTIPLAGKF